MSQSVVTGGISGLLPFLVSLLITWDGDHFVWNVLLVMLPSVLFLLGYHLGRTHERRGWNAWLKTRTR